MCAEPHESRFRRLRRLLHLPVLLLAKSDKMDDIMGGIRDNLMVMV